MAIARLACTLLAFLILAGCPPALVDAPPPTPSTVRAVAEGGCFSASDCSGQQICVDPRYPVCGAIPACEEAGQIRCGCACVAACTAGSCGTDEVCGAGGCCEPKTCTGDTQCGSSPDARCVSGRCIRRGTCTLPPP